jgi:MFS transporter, DHA2 family, multidrug resistance protein
MVDLDCLAVSKRRWVMLCILFGLGLFVVGVGSLGIGDERMAMGEIVAGVFCFGLFVRQQLQHPKPMLPFDLFRIVPFAASMWISVCS